MSRNAYLLLILTSLFWGGNAVAGKLAVGHVSPMVLTTLRWVFAALMLAPFAWPHLRRDWPLVRRNLAFLLVMGAVGFTAFNAALYSALQYTSTINVSIEQAALPMVIFAINFALFRLRVTWLQIAGFVISLVGVAFVASHGELRRLAELDVNFGDALMVAAILAYGAYTAALRYKPPVHWLSLLFVLVLAAVATSIPFAMWEASVGNAILPDARGWALVAYTAVFPSLLSQAFYIRGVELIGGNRAGLFINLVPIFGTLGAIVILAEPFFAYHAIAIVLVLGGIAMAEASGRRQAVREAETQASGTGTV
jgi:drug/metabolite transporter (DMT)-like permease